jgi:hypothetical protein
MVLLVVAALLARTAVELSRTEVGFDVARLLSVAPARQPKGFDEAAYLRMAVEALRHVPGVERVAVAEHVPWGSARWIERFTYQGQSHEISVFSSDSELPAALGLPIRRGRVFTAEEASHDAPVALISEQVARAFFPGTDPIGQPLSRVPWVLTSPQWKLAPATIVGVVGDALVTRNDASRLGAIYRPIRTKRSNPALLVVRIANPNAASARIVDALRRVNANVRVQTRPVRDRLDSFVASRRMVARLAAPLAVLTLVLAGLGVFGVTAFVVGQRRQEVSLRLAIGASATEITRLLVAGSLRPVLLGAAVGLAAGIALARVTAHEMLGGISPYDPASLAAAVSTLALCALAAAVVPARRAARVDPARLLRDV